MAPKYGLKFSGWVTTHYLLQIHTINITILLPMRLLHEPRATKGI